VSELQVQTESRKPEVDQKTIEEIERVLGRVAVKKPPVIVAPVYNKDGSVLRPAFDVANGTLANGQDPDTFYERTSNAHTDADSYFDPPSAGMVALHAAEREARSHGLID
jgi:hypothetical protein